MYEISQAAISLRPQFPDSPSDRFVKDDECVKRDIKVIVETSKPQNYYENRDSRKILLAGFSAQENARVQHCIFKYYSEEYHLKTHFESCAETGSARERLKSEERFDYLVAAPEQGYALVMVVDMLRMRGKAMPMMVLFGDYIDDMKAQGKESARDEKSLERIIREFESLHSREIPAGFVPANETRLQRQPKVNF